MKRFLGFLLVTLCLIPAHAGLEFYSSSTQRSGVMERAYCGTGITCTKTFVDRITIAVNQALTGTSLTLTGSATFAGSARFTGGIGGSGLFAAQTASLTIHPTWQTPTLTSGTSTTPVTSTLYMAQVFVPTNQVVSGIAINNAGTCGTNNYLLALYDWSGQPLAKTPSTACNTTSAWQAIAFTAPINIVGPAVYWVGATMNGTTDRFYTIPAVGQMAGLSGTVTGQSFGQIIPVTPPTTFTAGAGPVAFIF
jgi:hypothetical protein